MKRRQFFTWSGLSLASVAGLCADAQAGLFRRRRTATSYGQQVSEQHTQPISERLYEQASNEAINQDGLTDLVFDYVILETVFDLFLGFEVDDLAKPKSQHATYRTTKRIGNKTVIDLGLGVRLHNIALGQQILFNLTMDGNPAKICTLNPEKHGEKFVKASLKGHAGTGLKPAPTLGFEYGYDAYWHMERPA